MAEARGVRLWQVLAVVLALGLGGGYVWMRQSQTAPAAEKVAGGVVVKPVSGGSAPVDPSGLSVLPAPAAADGFVAPAIDEAQPGEEGE